MAIAKRERQRPEKQVQGIRLLRYQQALEEAPESIPDSDVPRTTNGPNGTGVANQA
jgi:hypothetical protein